MEGYLKISAYSQSVGMPVGGARVCVSPSASPERVIEELYTDGSGQTPDVGLPAPPLEYSLEPGRPRPYSLYDVSVRADGFDDVDVRGVQILPNEEAFQDVVLIPGAAGQREEITIPASTLFGPYPEKRPEASVKRLPQPTGFVVLPEPVIPEFIIVHAGVPDNASAPNHWVRFKDYVKNVASSEIYSTWPIETLRANILAIISLALNRVYTEWYRNRGYNFTIVSHIINHIKT